MENNNEVQAAETNDESTVVEEEVITEEEEEEEKKDKEPFKKTLIRVIISILIIAVGIFLVLWIVSLAAQYDSISDMLRDMSNEVNLMIRRIQGRE